MSERNNGGPAFPFSHEIESDKPGMRAVYVEEGMSLRDYFAAKAMQGLMANPAWWDYIGGTDSDKTATAAYRAADAMLRERK